MSDCKHTYACVHASGASMYDTYAFCVLFTSFPIVVHQFARTKGHGYGRGSGPPRPRFSGRGLVTRHQHAPPTLPMTTPTSPHHPSCHSNFVIVCDCVEFVVCYGFFASRTLPPLLDKLSTSFIPIRCYPLDSVPDLVRAFHMFERKERSVPYYV